MSRFVKFVFLLYAFISSIRLIKLKSQKCVTNIHLSLINKPMIEMSVKNFKEKDSCILRANLKQEKV